MGYIHVDVLTCRFVQQEYLYTGCVSFGPFDFALHVFERNSPNIIKGKVEGGDGKLGKHAMRWEVGTSGPGPTNMCMYVCFTAATDKLKNTITNK